jgi:hypothetical protein
MQLRLLPALLLALSAMSSAAASPVGPGTVTLDILKFYDSDASGTFNGDPPQRGVRIAVRYTPPGGSTTTTSVVTDMTGSAWVMVPPGSTFVACERVPMSGTEGFSWVQTYPNAATDLSDLDVILVSGQWCYSGVAPLEGSLTLEFGNVCVGGDGNTPGFWSNQNGGGVLAANDPGWRNLLNMCNLVDGAGNPYDVPAGPFGAAHEDFSDWIHSNATNMAYKLSAHLAAMKLNVTYGFVPANSLIYAPGTQSANAAGFANVLDLIAEADAELLLHPTAGAGDAWLDYQTALKNALDAANNGENFAQSQSCGIDC